MKIKGAFRVVHLWLGLITGLVVFILGITGCIYVFAEDIREVVYRERFYVKPGGAAKLPLSKLLHIAQQSVGDEHKITRAKVYNLPGRAYEFRALKTDPKAFGHWNYYVYYDRVHVDPYNGQIIYKEDARNSFMTLLLSLHMQLLLGKAVGHTVVKWSVVGFVILLISGLVLWYPKKWSKKQIKNSFRIKWGAKFKRLNYDLHNVPGFYSFLILLVIALTGLMMAFELSTVQTPTVLSDTTQVETRAQLADGVIEKVQGLNPQAAFFYYNIPLKKEGTINVNAYVSDDNFYNRTPYKFDQYTGAQLYLGQSFIKLPLNNKVQAMAFDIHTGNALGLPGKIIAFLASLIAASLPVTGLIIWLGKKKKAKSSKDNQHKNKHKFLKIHN